MKTYKIGEVFELDGRQFRCLEDCSHVHGCIGKCALNGHCKNIICVVNDEGHYKDVYFECISPKLNEKTYKELINEDISVLNKHLPDCLERDHIESGLCEIDSNLSISEIREQLSHAFSCVDAATCALQHIEGELNKLDD